MLFFAWRPIGSQIAAEPGRPEASLREFTAGTSKSRNFAPPEFRRSPDRPDVRFVRLRLDDEAIQRAKQLLQTAAWRKENDLKGRPTAEQGGKSLPMAVIVPRDFRRLRDADLFIVRVAVEDRVQRGFAFCKIQDVMRRIVIVTSTRPTAWAKRPRRDSIEPSVARTDRRSATDEVFSVEHPTVLLIGETPP
jgi:hypothetical protein